jgi:hypothetical protein
MVGCCMIISNVEIIYIQAEKGKVLTNGEVYVPSERKVALSINDSIENWHEITEEEYNQKKKELELVQDENLY